MRKWTGQERLAEGSGQQAGKRKKWRGRALVDFAFTACEYLGAFEKKEKMDTLRKDFRGE